jgi:succinate dehydrogenase hydrophobic anchor subunit
MWLFTRVSGLIILLLAFIGFTTAFLMGARTQMNVGTLMRWTFFPNPNHVIDSEIPQIEMVWANSFWQIMQMLVVVFGATHGFNGLRVIIEDYLQNPALMLLVRSLIFVLWGFVMIVSIYVILTS